MRNVFLALAFLVSASLFASSMDVKGGFVRFEGGENGLNVAPTLNYTLYTAEEGVIRGVDLGMGAEFAMAKPAGDFAYNLYVGPQGKVFLPYSYIKMGFGYNYSRIANVNCNDLAVMGGIGFFYPVDGAKIGLDLTATQIITGTKSYMISVGPMVSFDL